MGHRGERREAENNVGRLIKTFRGGRGEDGGSKIKNSLSRKSPGILPLSLRFKC